GPRPSATADMDMPKSSMSGKMHKAPKDMLTMWSHISMQALLFVVALLIGAVAWMTYATQPMSQAKFIDDSNLQPVFLNTGQVYFGNVRSLNKDYLVLTNVYYLQSSSTTNASSNQNVSLVKLGCELHMPYDRMVVNTAQVTFWENLQGDGQVAKAVKQFQQQNPDGQKCSTQTTSSSTNPQNQATSK